MYVMRPVSGPEVPHSLSDWCPFPQLQPTTQPRSTLQVSSVSARLSQYPLGFDRSSCLLHGIPRAPEKSAISSRSPQLLLQRPPDARHVMGRQLIGHSSGAMRTTEFRYCRRIPDCFQIPHFPYSVW